jgi:hypothetical protein
MSATVRLTDSESVDPNDAEAFFAYVKKGLATLRAHVQRLDEDIAITNLETLSSFV